MCAGDFPLLLKAFFRGVIMASIRKDRGWFYLRKNRKPNSWSIYYEFYKDGIRQKAKKLEIHSYPEFGFKSSMTTIEAKKRVQQLNKERKIDKNEIKKIIGAAKNLTALQTLDEVLFPQEFVTEFDALLETESFGQEAHIKRLKSHFNFIQAMMIKLKLYPRAYGESAPRIYKHLIDQKLSIDYSKKIISMINRWAEFICRKEGSFFSPIKIPKGKVRASIQTAQKTKSGKNTELGVRTESKPLTPEILKSFQDRFTNPAHFNWLKISLWFGLRPSEVDSLHGNKWGVEIDPDTGCKILRVYQSKLTGLSEEKRFKQIPVLFKEQYECLTIIESKEFKRPHPKTVRKNLKDEITLYGGRKGFTDLMLEKNQKVEDISIWLGHSSIETTWKHYKDKKSIHFTMTPEVKKMLKGI